MDANYIKACLERMATPSLKCHVFTQCERLLFRKWEYAYWFLNEKYGSKCTYAFQDLIASVTLDVNWFLGINVSLWGFMRYRPHFRQVFFPERCSRARKISYSIYTRCYFLFVDVDKVFFTNECLTDPYTSWCLHLHKSNRQILTTITHNKAPLLFLYITHGLPTIFLSFLWVNIGPTLISFECNAIRFHLSIFICRVYCMFKFKQPQTLIKGLQVSKCTGTVVDPEF